MSYFAMTTFRAVASLPISWPVRLLRQRSGETFLDGVGAENGCSGG